MRNYAIDSEAARARILAASLLADGALDRSEIELMEQRCLATGLGISSETLERVIREFCEDIDQYGARSDSGELELGRDTIDRMLDEIRDRDLQAALLRAIIEIVCVDRSVSGAEAALASQAMLRWRISAESLGFELHPYSLRWPVVFDRASMGARL